MKLLLLLPPLFRPILSHQFDVYSIPLCFLQILPFFRDLRRASQSRHLFRFAAKILYLLYVEESIMLFLLFSQDPSIIKPLWLASMSGYPQTRNPSQQYELAYLIVTSGYLLEKWTIRREKKQDACYNTSIKVYPFLAKLFYDGPGCFTQNRQNAILALY